MGAPTLARVGVSASNGLDKVRRRDNLRRQGDKETRRQGDKETRRQGDKETREARSDSVTKGDKRDKVSSTRRQDQTRNRGTQNRMVNHSQP
jgi:hypothetical protein